MEVKQAYYGTADIAKLMNVSPNTALQYMHMFERQGKAFRFGRVLRVKIRDFEQWVKHNTVPAGEVSRWG